MSSSGTSKVERAKIRTLELYSSLPQQKEERTTRLDVRDEVITLNYSFFGYIASHTFINNSSVTYEDKLQSALLHFCECWWWYKWKGDETHKGYRDDLSFTVFFKPRLSEMIERELNEVKYSVRRSLCMEAGKQLDKHWGQVRYEDLSKVDLPPDKMLSLKAIFGTLYTADLSDYEMYFASPLKYDSPFENPTDQYDSIEDLLVHDMIVYEEKLTDSKLLKMSDIYGIPFDVLKEKLPCAEKRLYTMLMNQINI